MNAVGDDLGIALRVRLERCDEPTRMFRRSTGVLEIAESAVICAIHAITWKAVAEATFGPSAFVRFEQGVDSEVPGDGLVVRSAFARAAGRWRTGGCRLCSIIGYDKSANVEMRRCNASEEMTYRKSPFA